MGIDESSSPNRLIYQFMHPGGGIQVQRGSFFSGGKTPENLHAYGSLELGETLDVKNNKIQWCAHRSGGTNVNFYAKPLTSAINISNDNMVAKNGDIISYKQFATNVKELKKSSPLFEFVEVEESSEEKAAPHYVDSYQILS